MNHLLLRVGVCVSLLAGLAAAQNDGVVPGTGAQPAPPPQRPSNPPPPPRAINNQARAEARVEAHERAAITAACSAMSGIRPQRIAPGESGECYVILVLRDSAVLPTSAPFELTYDEVQGPLTLGAWQRDPPPANGYSAALGQTVYDNTATVHVPVTVAAGTAFGRYPAVVEAKAELHDGNSGDPIGTFREAMRIQVEVGPALPTPVLQQHTGDEVPVTNDPPATGEPAAAADEETPAPNAVATPPARLVDDGNGPPVEPEPEASDNPLPEGGGGELPLLALAGGALGVLLLALAWRHLRAR